MDREGDVFALFAEQRRLGSIDLLVRAKHNRSLGQGVPKLFDAVRAEAAQARLEIPVGRLSARRGSRGQQGSGSRRWGCAGRRWNCRHRQGARRR